MSSRGFTAGCLAASLPSKPAFSFTARSSNRCGRVRVPTCGRARFTQLEVRNETERRRRTASGQIGRRYSSSGVGRSATVKSVRERFDRRRSQNDPESTFMSSVSRHGVSPSLSPISVFSCGVILRVAAAWLVVSLVRSHPSVPTSEPWHRRHRRGAHRDDILMM